MFCSGGGRKPFGIFMRGEKKPFGKGSFLSPQTPLFFSKTFYQEGVSHCITRILLQCGIMHIPRHNKKFGKEDRGDNNLILYA
jgi:hypothetical protein